jgi:hypothetical protein
MLDGEVGDAAPGIELEGRGKGPCRTDFEAAGAAAAPHGVRHVGIEFERGVDRAEEQPAAVPAADEVGMLALPADTRGLRQRLFHHRRGVDEDLEIAFSLF